MNATTTNNKNINIGGKRPSNYAAAVATRLGQGETQVTLRARGKSCATAVDAANQAATIGFCDRPSTARIGQELGPDNSGRIAWLEVDVYPTGNQPSATNPGSDINSKPVIIAAHPIGNYTLSIQHRLNEMKGPIKVRARGKHIAMALSAVMLASNMNICQRPQVAHIGEETAPGGSKQVSFIEIVVQPIEKSGDTSVSDTNVSN